MSLITQCPACSTMFRVVPDQLRISEGWVRCGQCDEVFDANVHLRNLEETQSLPPADAPAPDEAPAAPAAVQLLEPASEPAAEPEPDAAVATPHEDPQALPAAPLPAPPPDSAAEATGAYDWGPLLTPAPVGGMPEIVLDVGAPLADAPAYVPEADPFLEHSPQESLAEGSAPIDDWVAHHELEVSALRHSEALEEQGSAAMGPLAGEAPLSFMEQGAETSGAQRGPGKAVWLLLCTLLVFLLGMQWLLLERDRLAATAPALRPLLAGSCQLLGCAIAAPLQIDSIAIDSSAFTSVKPGVYLLKLTLKNAAAIDLATPALELTLTDSQDQALLRRIVLPAAFNGTRPMAAGAELAASLPVSIRPGAVPEKIAGYKLLAFYP